MTVEMVTADARVDRPGQLSMRGEALQLEAGQFDDGDLVRAPLGGIGEQAVADVAAEQHVEAGGNQRAVQQRRRR